MFNLHHEPNSEDPPSEWNPLYHLHVSGRDSPPVEFVDVTGEGLSPDLSFSVVSMCP